MESEAAIQVENLRYVYPGGYEALKGVNLAVKKGEFIAIMGENGSGKTTLIKHFNGVLKPTEGRVLIDGVDTRETPVSKLSRKVGIVFQNPDHQLFSETVWDEVAFPMKNFGFPEQVVKERTERFLKLMGLYSYRDKSPYLLSLGERKRLTIAAVLAYDPEIIVLDEPTAGQDYIQKEHISGTMNLLRTMQKTVVIVTHDMEFVVQYVDRIVLMSRGRIVASASPHEVLLNPSLLASAGLMPPQLARLALQLSRAGIYTPRRLPETGEIVDAVLKRWHR